MKRAAMNESKYGRRASDGPSLIQWRNSFGGTTPCAQTTPDFASCRRASTPGTFLMNNGTAHGADPMSLSMRLERMKEKPVISGRRDSSNDGSENEILTEGVTALHRQNRLGMPLSTDSKLASDPDRRRCQSTTSAVRANETRIALLPKSKSYHDNTEPGNKSVKLKKARKTSKITNVLSRLQQTV